MSRAAASPISRWEADERKLQSVYEDLSSHRLSSAQSTLTRWLKKNPRSQPALIAKMYVLQKTGAGEHEILDVYEEVKALGEMSGRGVWWAGRTLRNMARLDLALELYLGLSEKLPNTPAVDEQVFLHAVAAARPDLAVKYSRKMFNATREERWGRIAAWAEWVKNAPQPTHSQPFPDPAPESSLKIALLLLNTSTKTSFTPGTVWLKLQILLSAGQLDEALAHLKAEAAAGSLARLWVRIEGVKEISKRLEKRGEDGKVAQVWRDERDWVEALLKEDTESQRNYAFYQYLILATKNVSSDSELVKATARIIQTLHREIGAKERAPALALLELQAFLHAQLPQSEVASNDEDWLKAVQAYWIQWGAKGSVVSEIEGVAGDDEARRGLLQKFVEEQAGTQHTDEQTYREQVNAGVYLLRNRDSSWSPTIDDAKRYWDLYKQGLQYGKNLPKTDVKPSDTAGLVAVALLLTTWYAKPDDVDVLYKAVLCLEAIVQDSPACTHGRYLLIRLYRLIGAPSLTSSHLQSLKLSEIKLDNLLHIVTERGGPESVLGRMKSVWEDHVEKAEHMYERTAAEFPDYVKDCLTNESYSQIPSLHYLESSIANSVSHQILIVEKARVSLQRTSVLDDKLLKGLGSVSALREEEIVDLRNWDLIYELGGKRASIKDLTAGIGGVDARWIRAFGGVYEAVAKLLAGQAVGTINIPSQGLLPAETALLKGINKILELAGPALSPAAEEGAGQPAAVSSNEEIKAIFDENVRLASALTGRWETLQSLSILSELIKLVDLISSSLGDIVKPSKGKKRAAPNPVLAGLVADLKVAREGLTAGLGPVVECVEVLKREELDGTAIGMGWFGDGGFTKTSLETIANARKEALGIAQILLSGKNASAAATATATTGKPGNANGSGGAKGKGKKK